MYSVLMVNKPGLIILKRTRFYFSRSYVCRCEMQMKNEPGSWQTKSKVLIRSGISKHIYTLNSSRSSVCTPQGEELIRRFCGQKGFLQIREKLVCKEQAEKLDTNNETKSKHERLSLTEIFYILEH